MTVFSLDGEMEEDILITDKRSCLPPQNATLKIVGRHGALIVLEDSRQFERGESLSITGSNGQEMTAIGCLVAPMQILPHLIIFGRNSALRKGLG